MAAAAVKWICVQDGAREHYALPRALHRQGRLALLATEFWGGPTLRRLKPGRMRALGLRWHADLDGAKLISWNTRYLLRRFRRAVRGSKDTYEAFARNGRWFSEQVRNWLERHEVQLGNKVVFSYDTTALELFRFARERGARCLLGQMDPSRVEFGLVREEEKRWPGWALERVDVPEDYLARREREWALADRVMVNSEFCRRALVRQNVPEEKLLVVPLCYEQDLQSNAGVLTPKGIANRQSSMDKDGALRVLFLGQVILRKGIQYLVEAAKLLREENVLFDVVGPIGISDEAVKSAPPNVIFHGRVMRDNASKWYKRANLFVLPTLSDGFAITQLEAMAHGLPVIATPNCGEVVTDGMDGFVIPIRNSFVLASTIQAYLKSRGMLAVHSAAALKKAARFSLESLSEKIQELEKGTANPHPSNANPHQRLSAKISVPSWF